MSGKCSTGRRDEGSDEQGGWKDRDKIEKHMSQVQ